MNALDTYLKENDLNDSAFARLSGLKQPTVWRTRRGKTLPSPTTALRIEEATGGAVTLRELLFPEKKEE